MLFPWLFLLSTILGSAPATPQPSSLWSWGHQSHGAGELQVPSCPGKGLGEHPVVWVMSGCLPALLHGLAEELHLSKALTQAGLASPQPRGTDLGSGFQLINPWPHSPPSFPPSLSWFFQEPHPSVIWSLCLQGFGKDSFPGLPPLAHSLPFHLLGFCSVVYFSPLFFLSFHVPRHTGREIGSCPIPDPAVQTWGMSTLLIPVAAQRRRRRRRPKMHPRNLHEHLLGAQPLQHQSPMECSLPSAPCGAPVVLALPGEALPCTAMSRLLRCRKNPSTS